MLEGMEGLAMFARHGHGPLIFRIDRQKGGNRSEQVAEYPPQVVLIDAAPALGETTLA